MIANTNIIFIYILLILIAFLSFEKVKLAWEISKLYQNYENQQVEFERFKEHNLKLLTQYHAENSIGIIERQSIEILGMSRIKPIQIITNEKGK